MKPATIDRILCPIDFSEFSRDALDYAVALANWYGATLTLMHVVEVPPIAADGLPAAGSTYLPPPSLDAVAEEVRDFGRTAIETADVPVDVLVTYGTAAKAIQRQAEEMRADLVVVGTHGRSGFQRFLLGSVTERLLRALPVPLLVVPPPVTKVKKPDTPIFQTILCPVDFSDESLRALDYALSLAQESGGRIILLHVLEEFPDQTTLEQAGSISLLEYLRKSEDEALERLKALVPDDARVWAEPIERIATGRAYQRILAMAEHEHAGLIVMGIRGRSALNRLLFGSTAERVVREARCPVLTLHAEVADQAHLAVTPDNVSVTPDVGTPGVD